MRYKGVLLFILTLIASVQVQAGIQFTPALKAPAQENLDTADLPDHVVYEFYFLRTAVLNARAEKKERDGKPGNDLRAKVIGTVELDASQRRVLDTTAIECLQKARELDLKARQIINSVRARIITKEGLEAARQRRNCPLNLPCSRQHGTACSCRAETHCGRNLATRNSRNSTGSYGTRLGHRQNSENEDGLWFLYYEEVTGLRSGDTGMINRTFFPIVVGALTLLLAPKLHAQADMYSCNFLTFDQENNELYGYSAISATYDVMFFYEVVMETTLLIRDGKTLDVASANSSDDEYVIAEVCSPSTPGTRYLISGKLGAGPYYSKNEVGSYDVFNFQYWAQRAVVRRNYSHFMGKGPARYVKESEMDPTNGFGRTRGVGKLAIDVQAGRACLDGGCVVLSPLKTSVATTKLTAAGIAGPGKYQWLLGPKLAFVGSHSGAKIHVRGTSLSGAKGDTSVSLVYVPRSGSKQTASIRFTIRGPISLASLGVGEKPQ